MYLLICTWFLKNQVGQTWFLSNSNLIFAGYTVSKNQFRNIQTKNQVEINREPGLGKRIINILNKTKKSFSTQGCAINKSLPFTRPYLKGQLISKGNCQAIDSPKKWTSQFAFFDLKSCYVLKSNAVHLFFGRIYGAP